MTDRFTQSAQWAIEVMARGEQTFEIQDFMVDLPHHAVASRWVAAPSIGPDAGCGGDLVNMLEGEADGTGYISTT